MEQTSQLRTKMLLCRQKRQHRQKQRNNDIRKQRFPSQQMSPIPIKARTALIAMQETLAQRLHIAQAPTAPPSGLLPAPTRFQASFQTGVMPQMDGE